MSLWWKGVRRSWSGYTSKWLFSGTCCGDLVCGSVPKSIHWSCTMWLLLVPSSLCYMLLGRFCNVTGLGFLICEISDSSNHLMRGFVSWTSWFMKSSQVYSKDCVWDTVLTVISTYDTWIAVWGHADSLKTSQMCLREFDLWKSWFMSFLRGTAINTIYGLMEKCRHVSPPLFFFFWSYWVTGRTVMVECEFLPQSLVWPGICLHRAGVRGPGYSLWRCCLDSLHVSHTQALGSGPYF